MQKIDLVFDHFHELDGFVGMHSSGNQLVCADTVFDAEVFADLAPYRIQTFDGEPRSVL